MKHVVVSEPHICPKCLISNVGSAESILDLLICPKCAEKYRKELMPKIEKQVREFFQPERSKREDQIEKHSFLGPLRRMTRPDLDAAL